MRRYLIAPALLLLWPVAGAAQSNSRPSSPAVTPANLIAVFGDHPLADSTIAVLTREGFAAVDRSASAIERARRTGVKLPPAPLAIVVAVRYDTLSQRPILVAELLNVTDLSRLRLASTHWPAAGEPWGEAVARVVRQVLQP